MVIHKQLHILGTASFCRIRNGTISFIIQKLVVLGVGSINMFGSNERAKALFSAFFSSNFLLPLCISLLLPVSNAQYISDETLAPWLPKALSMLADIPWRCPIVKDLVVDVSVGRALKGLQYLHLTLWLLSDVCYANKGSLPQSVRWWWGQLERIVTGLPAVLEGVGWLVCSTGFTKQCHLCP